jgi:exonuclease III
VQEVAVAGTASLTLVTWNLNHWRQSPESRAAAWDYLAGPLADLVDWDVALLQECSPPADWPHPMLWTELEQYGWGTGVTARRGALRSVTLEDDSHPGCIVAAELDLNGQLVTLASLYGRQEHAKQVDGERYEMKYAITAVHRMLSDLTPLIDQRGRRRRPTPLVLAGDLNVSTQLAPPDRERHAGILRRCEELGLTDGWTVSPDAVRAEDCDCADTPGCGHVRTHTHNRSARPWQLDYVLANRVLRFDSCRTVLDDVTWQRSDHAPVVARLTLV